MFGFLNPNLSGCTMRRNPGNYLGEVKIYPDAKRKSFRIQFTKRKKINLKEDEDPRCIVQTFRKNHTSRYTNGKKSYQKNDRSQIVRDFINFKNHTSRSTNWKNRIKKVIVRKSFAMSSTSYRISESQIEVPNLLIKNQNRRKTIAKAYFFFWSLRGRGKLIRDDFFSKARAFPYFIFFFGTSKWGSDMRRARFSEKEFRKSS